MSTTSIVSIAGEDSRVEELGVVRVSTTLRVVESLTTVVAIGLAEVNAPVIPTTTSYVPTTVGLMVAV